MSGEKVVRYDLASQQFGFGTEAFPIESADGRYIEYADVAVLVEALKSIQYSASQGTAPGNDKKRELELIFNTTTQALARFQP